MTTYKAAIINYADVSIVLIMVGDTIINQPLVCEQIRESARLFFRLNTFTLSGKMFSGKSVIGV